MTAVAEPVPSTSLPRIAAPALRRALIAGIRRVIARREWLNRINVFPVPDGDTGSNLAFTLSSVLGNSLSRRARAADELLAQVAADAIDGARGNSGAIMAQFFHGLGEGSAGARVLTPQQLGQAVQLGATQAVGALAEPREGTILSVIRAFAAALQDWPAGARGLADWFGDALQRARAALADTPKQLPVLRQAGVVDAGAQGFVDLLEGVYDFIVRGDTDLTTIDHSHDDDLGALHAEPEIDATQPWCSECVIEADDGAIARATLQAALAAFGAGSVVLAGGARRLRLHAHVADPAALFALAGRYGRVSARKAEDMRMQRASALNAQALVVLTDSGADLPAERMQALAIPMVSARVSFGADEFIDKVSLAPAEFYARLRTSAELPQTSQPPPGDFRRQFEFLLTHHAEVLYVGLSRAVSGTLQAGESAAARCDAARIRVVDSGHASCGQGLLVLAAAEAAQRGGDAAAVAAEVERLRPLTQTFAIARDLSHGVRGGRVPRWARPLIEGLGLTPVARVRADGRLGICGALLGRQVPQRFARFVADRLPAGQRWRVLVGHCDCPADGEALLGALLQRLDVADGWLVEAGPAIGAHAGPGALVVGVQPVAGETP